MKDTELPSPRSAPNPPVSAQVRRDGYLRYRLCDTIQMLDDDENVYINGATFKAEEIRFLIACLEEPKP